ncbi:UNVERIFIED_CONTAM: hypothetical protein RKD43_006923 [Streptomyces graminofaciens]|jgi:hypothetical protein
MSQYFQTGDQVLWNPSTGVARVFLRTAEALSLEAAIPSGIGPMLDDESQIDIPNFEVFVNALVLRYQQSRHPILRSLLEGFIATALVLVERGGGDLPDREEPLAELCQRHARAM